MRFHMLIACLVFVACDARAAYAQEKLPAVASPVDVPSSIQPNALHPFGPSGDELLPALEVPQGSKLTWIVSIGRKGVPHGFGGHFCGGSVIDKRWILTAAHCVAKFESDHWVPLDANRIDIKIGFELQDVGHTYEVEPHKILVHEKFAQTPFNSLINDIALIKSTQDIATPEVAQLVRPVNLAFVKPDVMVLGWGKPAAHLNYLNNRLRMLALRRISNEACNNNYYHGLVDDHMICAVGEGRDACQGDSGGPLLGFDARNQYYLFGIVSWGEQCGATSKPGIYVQIPSYISWIEATIHKN